MRPLSTEEGIWPSILANVSNERCSVEIVIASENDHREARELFPESTIWSSGFLGFRQPFGSVSLTSVKTLSSIARHPSFSRLKLHVLNMLNRHDTTGAFRLVDREAFFYEAFFGVGGLLIEKKISHVIFDVTPHVVLEFIVFWLAKKLAIDVVFLQPIPVAGLSVPRCDVDRKFVSHDDNAGVGAGPAGSSAFFREQLDSFIDRLAGGSAVWVQRFLGPEIKKLESSRLQIVAKVRRFINLADNPNSAGIPGISVLPTKFSGLLQSILVWAHRKSFQLTRESNSSQNIPTEPFLLYAMTHEPERTFFPEGLPWDSQLEVIAHLAALKNDGVNIVVKEHETQYAPGRLGYGSRSSHFYRVVEEISNVQVISSKVPAQSLLLASDGVVSATGTICVEAALLGKPAYYYGNPWWEGFPGTVKVSQSDFDAGAFPACPGFSTDSYEVWANTLIAGSVVSTANVGLENFEGKFTALPGGYASIEKDALASMIENFLFNRGAAHHV